MAAIDNYRRNLRAAVRGLWQGVLTLSQASNAFESTLENSLTIAWNEGAAECGIAADELTQQELVARDEFIFEQVEFSGGFLSEVVKGSRSNRGLLRPQLKRVELWINRFNDAKNQAKSLACTDQKGQWFLGPTEKHCRSCSGFDGKVYRFSTWQANGALPQSERLACKGFNCQCDIKPTDKRVTPGKFPVRLLN